MILKNEGSPKPEEYKIECKSVSIMEKQKEQLKKLNKNVMMPLLKKKTMNSEVQENSACEDSFSCTRTLWTAFYSRS